MRGIKIFKRFGVIALQPVRAGHEIAAAFLPAARFGTGGEEDEIAILGVKLDVYKRQAFWCWTVS